MTYKEDMNFKDMCFYEAGKLVVSEHIMSSGIPWFQNHYE